jgi:GT2 family glycosyltransferase
MEIDTALIEKEISTTAGHPQPAASVVVVTYNTNKKLLTQNLDSLFRGSAEDFEVIIVDNSDRKNLEPVVSRFPVRYIKLKENAGLSTARNVGTGHALGDIVIFLDDDAIPARDLVEEHLKAYKHHDIVGLRGKALPRTRTIYNELATNYDLGNDVFPHYINLEGNSSFKREILHQVGGFYSRLKGAGGYEGAELSYRIVNHLEDRSRLIYYPGAVIYHDYCGSFFKYLKKRKRHSCYINQLTAQYPDLAAFMEAYTLPPGSETGAKPSPLSTSRLWTIKKSVSLLLKISRAWNLIARY